VVSRPRKAIVFDTMFRFRQVHIESVVTGIVPEDRFDCSAETAFQ
jgi:hypothetical protein